MFPVPAVPKPTLFELIQLNVVPAVGLEKLIPATEIPPQKTLLAMAFTVGVGLTVTVKVLLTPGHPPTLGITVTVAVNTEVPAFVAVKAGMFPVPETPKPTFTLDDQEKVALGDELEKLMPVEAELLHKGKTVMLFTVARCLTVTVKVVGTPGHPPVLGVTVTVATISDVPLLLATKAGILPVPETPKPTFVVLVHSKVAPELGLEKLIPVPEASSQ